MSGESIVVERCDEIVNIHSSMMFPFYTTWWVYDLFLLSII